MVRGRSAAAPNPTLQNVKWRFLSDAALGPTVRPQAYPDDSKKRISHLEKALASTHDLEAQYARKARDYTFEMEALQRACTFALFMTSAALCSKACASSYVCPCPLVHLPDLCVLSCRVLIVAVRSVAFGVSTRPYFLIDLCSVRHRDVIFS